jgi:hypothetical protein
VTYCTFTAVRERIQQQFDFTIELANPYKLCDYKVTYGEVFQKELSGFDYWGYCDVDLVFGDIRAFLPDSRLNQYEKLFSRGHFTLFHNTAENNARYRAKINNRYRFREVFTSRQNCSFDEWSPSGINEIFISQGIPIYDEIVFSDIYIARYGFYPYQQMRQKNEKYNSIFLWEKGKLTRFYRVDQTMGQEAVLYVHLQKRKMQLDHQIAASDRYLIIPNRYLPYQGETDLSALKPFFKDKLIYWDFLQMSMKNALGKFHKYLSSAVI